MRRALLSGYWIAVSMVVMFAVQRAGASDLRTQLDVIREGYLANRSAFRQGKCRFTYAIFSAASEVDALAGMRNDRRPRIARKYTLYLDGDTFTLKTELDGKKLGEEIESGSGLITPTTIAVKGAYAMDHDAVINNVIVYSPANYRLKIRYHPFNLASDIDSSPARAIEYASARDFAGTQFDVERAVRDGRSYIRLKQSADYNSDDTTWWIDPSRGYLSFVTQDIDATTGQFDSRMFLLETHRENGAYFPMHAILIIPRQPEGETPYVEVREMKVEELDLSYKPTAEDLTVYLPRSAQYSDGINPNTAKTLFREGEGQFTAVSVDDIEGIYNQLQAIAAQRTEEEAALATLRDPGSGKDRTMTYLLVGANLLALGVILLAWYVRRRRGRAGDTA